MPWLSFTRTIKAHILKLLGTFLASTLTWNSGMIAFCIYGQDAGNWAFRQNSQLTDNQSINQTILPDMSTDSRLNVHRCEACGELLNKWDEALIGLVVKQRKYDIASTYDGIMVVSKRFKIVYDSAALAGLTFNHLPDDTDFFCIRPIRSVQFDAEQRKTRFINPCPQCNSFESVVGATPVYLQKGTQIEPHEFVRTQLEFGSHDEKHPLLICGVFAGESLKKANLKGLDLLSVEYALS